MAGSISLSLSQQFDELGEPLNGGLLYFWAAGTTTPQSAYQDVALTLPYSNPIVLDAAGRVPAFYLADGQIKIRLTNAAGVTQVAADNLLVIGASSGSGSPPSVDATTTFGTGDIKIRYGEGTHSGWVRANGRTIGSASSGATERANSDCQELFEHLWGADGNLTVSGGRGATANADWVANKTIALPDFRGRVPAGVDTMGASAAGRLTTSVFGQLTSVLGASGGSETKTLVTANLPPYTPAGSVASNSTGADNVLRGQNAGAISFQSGGSFALDGIVLGSLSAGDLASSGTLTGTAQGGTSTAFSITQPTILVTFYIKL